MKYCANLTTMFKEYDFYERFHQAKRYGFDTVEVLFPYHYDLDKILEVQRETNIDVIGMDFEPGDFYNGEIGMLNNPDKIEEYRKGVDSSIEYAISLGVKKMNCLVGKNLPEVEMGVQMDTIINNLIYTSDKLKPHGITLLIEPINSIDNPGYLCDSCSKAEDLIRRVDRDNVAILFDVYHLFKMGHHVIDEFNKYKHMIDHVHISDCPGRTEPGKGEIPYSEILPAIREHYEGYIGLEYTNQESVFGNLKI